MLFCQWSESMSVGEPLLDADHKSLFLLINRLHEKLEAGADPAALGDVFERLINYINFHFQREEMVMKACGYPEAKAHREEHAGFAKYVHEMRERYAREADEAIIRELLDYLKTWLDHHILIQDMAYKPYVQDNDWASKVSRVFGPGLDDEARANPQRPLKVTAWKLVDRSRIDPDQCAR